MRCHLFIKWMSAESDALFFYAVTYHVSPSVLYGKYDAFQRLEYELWTLRKNPCIGGSWKSCPKSSSVLYSSMLKKKMKNERKMNSPNGATKIKWIGVLVSNQVWCYKILMFRSKTCKQNLWTKMWFPVEPDNCALCKKLNWSFVLVITRIWKIKSKSEPNLKNAFEQFLPTSVLCHVVFQIFNCTLCRLSVVFLNHRNIHPFGFPFGTDVDICVKIC